MANNSLGHPYANALFELAKDTNSVDTWLADLSNLAIIAQSKDFNSLISNPRLSEGGVLKVLLEMLGTSRESLVNFLTLLQENDRLESLPEIFELFEQKVEEDRNSSKAIIESAFELSNSDQKKLEKLLSDKFGKSITSTVEINPTLIGGIKIIINDTVIDSSVKGSLDKMAAKLIS